MKGKNVCITGANTGIGFQTALALAGMGARVIMSSRNQEKGAAALARIREAHPHAQVDLVSLDLASMASIEAFAQKVNEMAPSLDVLINNAGLICMDYQTTHEGFEYQIGINHLGHFLLFKRLLGALGNAPAARVVTVASAAHYGGRIDFERFRSDKGAYKGMPAYAQAKLANILFASELARRYPAIRSYSLHPGLVGSEFVSSDEHGRGFALGWNIFKIFALSPRQGARTSLFLATATPAPEPNGQYFNQRQRATAPSKLAQDAVLANALWEESERMWREAGAIGM